MRRVLEGQLPLPFEELALVQAQPSGKVGQPERKPSRDPRLPEPHREDIPLVSDLCWYLWVQPLHEFLVKPRPFVEVLAWAAARYVSVAMVRNMVAWLEIHRKLRWEGLLLGAEATVLGLPRNKA